MNETTSQDDMQVTTETERGKREYRSKNIAACFGGVLAFGMAAFVAQMSGDEWVRIFLFAMMGISGITCFAASAVQLRQRGDWRLNREGILFTSLRGKPRYLGWHNVHAIRWQTKPILFRADMMTMPLILSQESQERQKVVQQFLREVLCQSFDLSDRPAIPFSICRVLWGTLAAIPFVLLSLAGSFIQTTYLDPGGRWRQWGPLWLLVLLIPMLLASLITGRQETIHLWRQRQKGNLT
jgi:hypothetical protein